MTTYLFVGDTHGDLEFAQRAAEHAAEHDATIIQVGDWGFEWPGARHLVALDAILWRSGQVTMHFVDGNHDWHPVLPDLVAPHVIYQPRGSTYTDADGTRFLFQGGAPSIDWASRTPGRSWWPEEVITEEDHARALAVDGPIHVLVTHDAPDYPPGFAPKGDPAFRARSARSMEMIAKLVDHHQPELHVHGHWHTRYSRRRGSTEVVGLDCNFAPLGASTLVWSRA